METLRGNVPDAYAVVQGEYGRWFPLRFGKFRLDGRGYRISFGRREDAEAYCWNEQADYERRAPATAAWGW